MNIILGAAMCSLFLALCFLVPSYLYLWTLDNRVILDEHDPAYSASRGPVIYAFPEDTDSDEAIEHDLKDPLAVYGPTEDQARIARIKEKMNNKTVPTLPGKGQTSYVPIRAYKDRKEIETNHDLQIINHGH